MRRLQGWYNGTMLITLLPDGTGSQRTVLRQINTDVIPDVGTYLNYHTHDEKVFKMKASRVEWNIFIARCNVDIYICGADKEARDYIEAYIALWQDTREEARQL